LIKDSTVDKETLVPQQEYSLYSEYEDGLVEEGTAKMCHQKIKLVHSADNKFIENDRVPEDVQDLWNAWTSAVLTTPLPSYNGDKTSGKRRKTFLKRWKYTERT